MLSTFHADTLSADDVVLLKYTLLMVALLAVFGLVSGFFEARKILLAEKDKHRAVGHALVKMGLTLVGTAVLCGSIVMFLEEDISEAFGVTLLMVAPIFFGMVGLGLGLSFVGAVILMAMIIISYFRGSPEKSEVSHKN